MRQGKFGDELARYYSDDIVSIEPGDPPTETCGRAAVAAKVQAWFDEYEVHNVTAMEPLIHGDRIVIVLDINMTARADWQAVSFQEAAMYQVRDGQIIEERFFF